MREGIFFIIITFLLNSCANMVPPQGGEKDTEGPVIQSSVPSKNQRNFKPKQLIFTFNENIDVNNLTEQLIITPITENKYKYTVKNKTLVLTFEHDLLPNTTYNLNFRNGIKDITEGNSVKDFTLAFSTGDKLDTLKLSGLAKDLLTDQPLNGGLISLYKSGDTNSINNSKPMYVARTDNKGLFTIQNLKEGNYDIFALDDKDNNFLFNNTNERVAYIFNYPILKDTLVNLVLTRQDTIAPKISDVVSTNNEIQITLSEGIIDAKVQESDTIGKVFYKINEAKKITIFKSITTYDSISYIFTLTDSIYNQSVINKKLGFSTKKNEKEEKIQVLKGIDPADRKIIPEKTKIVVHFNYPIKATDFEKLRVKRDTIFEGIKKEEYTWNTERTDLTLNKTYSNFDSLFIIIPEGTFKAFNDSTNKLTKQSFTPVKTEDFSIMRGKVRTSTKNYIVQLLDDKFNILESRVNPVTFEFTDLKPGIYRLRVLKDNNGNGKWDNGNINKRTQPEEIYFYPDPIKTRANWEINDLILTF